MAKYIVASDEGALRFGAEVGEQVDLNLSPDEQRALIAAGWLDQPAGKAPADKEKK